MFIFFDRNGYMNIIDSSSNTIYRTGNRRRTMSQSKSHSGGQPQQGRASSINSNNESPTSPSVVRMDTVTSTQNENALSFQNSPLTSPIYSNGEVCSPAIYTLTPNVDRQQCFTFDDVPEMITRDSGSNPRESNQMPTPTRDGTIPRRVTPQTPLLNDQTSLGNESSSGNGRAQLGSGSNNATAATYQTSQGVGGYPEKPCYLSDVTQVTHGEKI